MPRKFQEGDWVKTSWRAPSRYVTFRRKVGKVLEWRNGHYLVQWFSPDGEWAYTPRTSLTAITASNLAKVPDSELEDPRLMPLAYAEL